MPTNVLNGRANNLRAKGVYVTKAFGRYVRWAPEDFFANRARDGEPVPPRRLSFVGRGDFQRTGNEYLDHFRILGGLERNARVLDMGCGIGRMAIPLMRYLDAGSYAGFDVGKEMIRWCQKNLTSRRSDFRFAWAPVFNQKYNPFGTSSASEFKFPYPDSEFDFAFATSLFTHLLYDDMAHYLREVSRVLRPGGTCFLTLFLLDDFAKEQVETQRAAFNFRYDVHGGRTVDAVQPEEAIAYWPAELQTLLGATPLEVQEPIHYGLWSNHPQGVAGQDIIIARRSDA